MKYVMQPKVLEKKKELHQTEKGEHSDEMYKNFPCIKRMELNMRKWNIT